jgi:hypothetical protein
MRYLVCASVILGAAFACGPVDSTGNGGFGATGTDGGAPDGGAGAASIAIVSPADGATITLDDDHGDDSRNLVSVAVDLRNVRVAGDCGSDSSCGILDVFVDDDQCGNPNGTASSGNQVAADFGKCRSTAGAHRLRAEIRRGSTLVVRSNDIHVTVQQGDDDHGDDDDGDDDHGGHDLRRR